MEGKCRIGVREMRQTLSMPLNVTSRLDRSEVRPLGAIHRATALSVSGLGGTVSYDARLAEAAKRSGIPVLIPGAGG